MRNPNTTTRPARNRRSADHPPRGTIGAAARRRNTQHRRCDRGEHVQPARPGRPVTGQGNDGRRDGERVRVHVIRDGLAAHLPDIDPEETAEWLESFDAVLDAAGQQRARYLMLRMLQRARERHVGVPVADQHGLRQHDPHRPRAVVPRRRGGRARLPPLDPVERRDDRAPRAAAGHRRGRAHLVLRVVGDALRGRLQPLLPRQGPPGRRRPGVHPGPRLPRHLRPRLPGGPAVGGPARRLPPGALARRPRPRAALLPAPAADARLLGVPHRLHGPRPDERDHAGPVQPVPGRARVHRHEPTSTCGRSSATARWTSRSPAG